jgi:hypothetical protein
VASVSETDVLGDPAAGRLAIRGGLRVAGYGVGAVLTAATSAAKVLTGAAVFLIFAKLLRAVPNELLDAVRRYGGGR